MYTFRTITASNMLSHFSLSSATPMSSKAIGFSISFSTVSYHLRRRFSLCLCPVDLFSVNFLMSKPSIRQTTLPAHSNLFLNKKCHMLGLTCSRVFIGSSLETVQTFIVYCIHRSIYIFFGIFLSKLCSFSSIPEH